MKLKMVGLVVHIVLIVLLFLFTGQWILNLTGVLLGLEIFAYVGLFILAAISIPRYMENSRNLIYFYAVSLINLFSLSILFSNVLFAGMITAVIGILLAAVGHKKTEEEEDGVEKQATPAPDETPKAEELKMEEAEEKEPKKKKPRKNKARRKK